MMGHRLLLMRLGLLESLSEEQITAVQEVLRQRRLVEGEMLFRQGDRCEHLHIVQDGALRLLAESNGGQHVLEVVREGNVMGEAGVFMSVPYPCSAEAAEKTLVSSLHREDLRRLANEPTGFCWQLLRLLSRRLVGMQMRVQALTSPDVRARVGAVLLQLAQEQAPPVRGGPPVLRVRQADLAQMAGVARETVSRLLSDWRRRGFLTVGRGRITMDDAVGLQADLDQLSVRGHAQPDG
jgi:CRP/FNR family transcriptional regulator, cyclic AMP receptor protein